MNNNDIQGSLSVSQGTTIGGNLAVRGTSTFDHNVKIKGWIDAKNIKGPLKGLFESEDELKLAYPEPQPGWFALVGNTLPAEVYRVKNGEWADTGQQGGEIFLSLDSIEEDINKAQSDILKLQETISEDVLAKVNLTDLDFDLSMIGKIISGSNSCKFVVMRNSKNVGILHCFSDDSQHMLTQVFTTHYIAPFSGGSLTHSDDKIYQYFRSYHLSGGTSDIPRGTWGEWKSVFSSDINTETVKLGEEDSSSVPVAPEVTADYANKALKGWDGNDLRKAMYMSGVLDYEEFSTSKAYAVGDIVSYMNKAYKFIAPHSAGAWDASQVEETNLKGEINNNAFNINKIESVIGEADFVSNFEFSSGRNDDHSRNNWFYSVNEKEYKSNDIILFDESKYILYLYRGTYMYPTQYTNGKIVIPSEGSYGITGFTRASDVITDAIIKDLESNVFSITDTLPSIIKSNFSELSSQISTVKNAVEKTEEDILNATNTLGYLNNTDKTILKTSFYVGRITGSTTPTEAKNWFYSDKFLLNKGDKIIWNGSKYSLSICVATSETSVYVNPPSKTGEYIVEKDYDFFMITGFTTGENITDEDIIDLNNTIYAEVSNKYKNVNKRIEEFENRDKENLSGVNGVTLSVTPIVNGDNQLLSYGTTDTNYYPNAIVWGWEYLQHWYKKIYNADTDVVVALSGDSITQGYEPNWEGEEDCFIGMRNWAIRKIMKAGNFPQERLRVINCGVGGRNTNEYVGNKNYPLWQWQAKYPNGFLDEDMKLNPDLYILAWGMNDADKTYSLFEGMTIQDRLNLFKENITEALKRIRGNSAVNERPAYNKTIADMSVIICMPTVGGDVSTGRGNELWNQYVREFIRPLCRQYGCAFADLTIRTIDYQNMTIKNWSQYNSDGSYGNIHPNKYANAQIMSALQDLIYPICMWNNGDIEPTEDDNVRYTPSN